jgi:TolB-like protein
MTRYTTCLIVLALLAAAAPAGAKGPKRTLVFGKAKTRWASSRACRGYAPSYADTVARSLRTRLAETGAFRIVDLAALEALGRKPGAELITDLEAAKKIRGADYLVKVEILCHPETVELGVQLVEVSSSDVVWAKAQHMESVDSVEKALGNVVGMIVRFARTLKVDIRKWDRLTLLPVRGAPGKLSAEDLDMATRTLRRLLREQVAREVPPVSEVMARARKKGMGACLDRACHLRLAVEDGGTKALAIEVVAVDRRCSVSYTLYDVKSATVERTGAVETYCRLDDVQLAIGEIVGDLADRP